MLRYVVQTLIYFFYFTQQAPQIEEDDAEVGIRESDSGDSEQQTEQEDYYIWSSCGDDDESGGESSESQQETYHTESDDGDTDDENDTDEPTYEEVE